MTHYNNTNNKTMPTSTIIGVLTIIVAPILWQKYKMVQFVSALKSVNGSESSYNEVACLEYGTVTS